MNTTIKVRIEASQTAHYNKEVELSKEDYDSLMEAYNSGSSRKLIDHLEGWFDDDDIVDWESLDDCDVTTLTELEDARKQAAND